MLAILIAVSFIQLAVFGFAATGHQAGHGYFSCAAVAVRGEPCAEDESPFGFANFHVSAFRDFAAAVLGNSAPSLAVLLLLFTLAFTVGFNFPAPEINAVSFELWRVKSSPSQTNHRRKFIAWLSLTEKRDPAPSFCPALS